MEGLGVLSEAGFGVSELKSGRERTVRGLTVLSRTVSTAEVTVMWTKVVGNSDKNSW